MEKIWSAVGLRVDSFNRVNKNYRALLEQQGS
jgi:hypothetical protein